MLGVIWWVKNGQNESFPRVHQSIHVHSVVFVFDVCVLFWKNNVTWRNTSSIQFDSVVLLMGTTVDSNLVFRSRSVGAIDRDRIVEMMGDVLNEAM